jgi:hypothetical protein
VLFIQNTFSSIFWFSDNLVDLQEYIVMRNIPKEKIRRRFIFMLFGLFLIQDEGYHSFD